jgi:hypothetical protein
MILKPGNQWAGVIRPITNPSRRCSPSQQEIHASLHDTTPVSDPDRQTFGEAEAQ